MSISKADKKKIDELGKSNYRIEFTLPRLKISYPFEFSKAEKFFPILEELYTFLDHYEIKAWHHFEPHVEFTYICDKGKTIRNEVWEGILKILNKHKCTIIQESPPNGFFADWYYTSYEEALFSIESMMLTAKLAMTFWKHNKAIKKGKGKDRMLMRRFHVLANQLAYSYVDESRILNLRSVFAAVAACGIDQDTTIKLYESITGKKY